MKILLVEDSEHDRIALRRAFAHSRMDDVLVEASSADEALALFNGGDTSFDVLVSDYKMRGMNGFDLCKEAMRLKTGLQTVLITACGDEELAAKSIKSGINDYIVKDVARGYIRKLYSSLDSLSPKARSPLRRPSDKSAQYAPRQKPHRLDDVSGRLSLSERMMALLGEECSDAILLEALKCLRSFGPFESIAIRMRKGGDYPFIADLGLSGNFIAREMHICKVAEQNFPLAPECLCGRVLMGEPVPGLLSFTPNGSFWCSDLQTLRNKLCSCNQFKPRGECLRAGFNSLCLVPIKVDAQIHGVILVGDKRCGVFDDELVAFLEKAAAFFGVCFERRLMRESLSGYSKEIEEFIRRRTHALMESNSLLQSETKALKDSESSLRSANAKLNALLKNKAISVAKLSHDLRMPLNAIMGFSALLLECGLEGENAEFAKLIMERGQDLCKLIQDIHDLAKLESGGVKLHVELVDLKNFVGSVAKGFEHIAAAKGIKLETEFSDAIPEELFADPLRVSQVVSNLLSNAIKFTEKGHVRLSVQPLASSSPGLSCLKFCVLDSGTGIPPAELARLFEDYAQVHSSNSKKREGSGLGLSICKNIVSLMDGRIWAESMPGEGSSFFFTMNFELPKPHSMPIPKQISKNLTQNNKKNA